MEWLLSLLGTAIVAVVLVDVFQRLAHPAGRGGLGAKVLRLPWIVSRALGGRGKGFAGPLGVVLVIVVWVALQVVGWALIYLPSVPEGFTYSPGIRPVDPIPEALYISLVTLGTLGFGDVVPSGGWLRLAAPLEAITGFVLLTGAISWFMQIYPALARSRTLALRLAQFEKTGFDSRLLEEGDRVTAQTVQDVAGQVEQVRVDLGQNSETYYFVERDPELSLPVALQRALRLGESAARSEGPSLALAGRMLVHAVSDVASLLRSQFLSHAEDDASAIIRAALADHGMGPDIAAGPTAS